MTQSTIQNILKKKSIVSLYASSLLIPKADIKDSLLHNFSLKFQAGSW